MNDKKLTKEDIYFGYEYCAICGRPLCLNEEDICDECFFETSADDWFAYVSAINCQ